MKTKRLIALFICFLLLLSLCACNSGQTDKESGITEDLAAPDDNSQQIDSEEIQQNDISENKDKTDYDNQDDSDQNTAESETALSDSIADSSQFD